MKHQPMRAKQMLGLTPESCDKLMLLLDQSLGDAIVLVQQYGLTEGVDIAIWEVLDKIHVRRIVLATGPIQRSPPFVSFAQTKISKDESIPRSIRIEKALAAEGAIYPAKEYETLEWVLNDSRFVEMSEYHRVKEIIDSLVDGCESVLGVDNSVWVMCQFGGKLSCLSKSWDGTIDFEKYWIKMKEILDMVGISNLPLQNGQTGTGRTSGDTASY